jgi:hypothetical protein
MVRLGSGSGSFTYITCTHPISRRCFSEYETLTEAQMEDVWESAYRIEAIISRSSPSSLIDRRRLLSVMLLRLKESSSNWKFIVDYCIFSTRQVTKKTLGYIAPIISTATFHAK